ncbi:MAG TPA: S24 family peptidase [Candidatus Duodenibacillus intestinigallinarum]|nr:S24 family peptidase [Candidatus Duodenibacillus intestinigallinarum]
MSLQEAKKQTQTDPVKKTSGRGGHRPGSGRKPIEGVPYNRHIVIRVSEEQRSTFVNRGGSQWIRTLIMQTQTNMQALENCIDPAEDSGIRTQGASDVEIGPTNVNLTNLLLGNKQSSFVVTVNGNAMDAAGIAHGDSVLIDNRRTPVTDDIVVVQIGDKTLLRRLAYDVKIKCPCLKAETTTDEVFEDLFPWDENRWQCLGVVTHSIRPFIENHPLNETGFLPGQ